MEQLQLVLSALVCTRLALLRRLASMLTPVAECLRNTVDVSQGIQREGTLQ